MNLNAFEFSLSLGWGVVILAAMFPTQDLHVKEIVRLLTPRDLKAELPMTEGCNATVVRGQMKTIPYRCDDFRHKALLGAARSTGTSVQRLFDNFVTHVITERQAEARFLIRQKRGDPVRGRKLLAEIRRRIRANAAKLF